MSRTRALGMMAVSVVFVAVFSSIRADDDVASLEADLKIVERDLIELRKAPRISTDEWADAQIFAKGARWAIDLDDALDKSKTAALRKSITRAAERIQALKSGKHPWSEQRGRLVRGFVSSVDGSTQPFGLSVPSQYDPQRPIRLDVVLHGSHGGRASGMGDIVYINQFDTKDEPTTVGPDVPYIELFPMGRLGENAYRFEGEEDIFEAIESVCRNYAIDRNRIVLRGSSLGGVGAWQIGLKRPDRFVAVGPAAGPVDTIEFANSKWPHFVRLDPLTPWQETTLHMVDAIDYTANARMVPVVAAMGDQDPYFTSHQLIEKAFEREGIPFNGLVDRGGGHGIRPPVMSEQLRRLGEFAAKGRDENPANIHFVTWTLKFNKCFWIELLRLGKHYERSEIVANRSPDGTITVQEPKNISRFAILPSGYAKGATPKLVVGDQIVALPNNASEYSDGIVVEKKLGKWSYQSGRSAAKLSGKRPGLQGPIDDAFATRFICVRGTGTPSHPAVHGWAMKQLDRFTDEWRRHYRGHLPIKNDSEVTDDDLKTHNLILFGDPGSNPWIAKVVQQLPITWNQTTVEVAGASYSAESHVPQLIQPNPLDATGQRYVVINSGHTYHDSELRFSYMVFPRLGDWAVVDATRALDNVIKSGFFGEDW